MLILLGLVTTGQAALADRRSVQVHCNRENGNLRQDLAKIWLQGQPDLRGWTIYEQVNLVTLPAASTHLMTQAHPARRGARPDLLLVPPVGPNGRPLGTAFFVEVTSPNEDKGRQRGYLRDLLAECQSCNLDLLAVQKGGKLIRLTNGEPLHLPIRGALDRIHRIVRVAFERDGYRGNGYVIYHTSTRPTPPPRP
jgi:hypothetical protein